MLEFEEHAALRLRSERRSTGAEISVTGDTMVMETAGEDLDLVVTETAGEDRPATRPGAEETPRWRRAPQRGQAPPGDEATQAIPLDELGRASARAARRRAATQTRLRALRDDSCGHVGQRSPCAAVVACGAGYDGAETGAASQGGDGVTLGGGREIALVGLTALTTRSGQGKESLSSQLRGSR